MRTICLTPNPLFRMILIVSAVCSFPKQLTFCIPVFFTEVIESLTRGFEDELLCDNLILEINSSRYAYNVTVKEVNLFSKSVDLHRALLIFVF